MESLTLITEQLRNIAQAGLYYTKDPYDRERYEQLLDLTIELITQQNGISKKTAYQIVNHEHGYITPKVDIRGLVLDHEQKILLVQEKIDNKWSIPGGWGDIGYSPTEVCKKEVKEEAGVTVQVDKLLAVIDRDRHDFPAERFYTYKLVFSCKLPKPANLHVGLETNNVGFFTLDEALNLPLSTNRITANWLKKLYTLALDNTASVYCD